ncbi:acyltransferase family protein [Peteryoungia desertarenae]|uniref:Acyltransferase family protein n=1 Tax=Peteryoungia desertarenae TaxID=1813451 RepID=A0ABX6QJN4_9HYPH|nr:acyltransferase family protein [Peteryoungia desertarenae]QLF68551.1 acyltransferase family protein [Peteryoungia desertarenae]
MTVKATHRHEWSAIRAVLMLLGIPYHAAMTYHSRVMWDIHSQETSEFLTLMSGIFVTFRMPAFFVVAGFFAAILLERRKPSQWLANRAVRLGIPFVTGLLLLSPVQLFLIRLADAVSGKTTYPQALDLIHNDISHPGSDWIMHLWFLPALLIYCVLLAVIVTPARHLTKTSSAAGKPDRSASITLISSPRAMLSALVAVTVAFEVTLFASTSALETMDSGIAALLARAADPYLRYIPYFALGVLLFHNRIIADAMAWKCGITLPAAAILTALTASLARGYGEPWLEVLHHAAAGAAAILLTAWLIGFANRHWTQPDAKVDRIVDASFTIYLLHHPIIYALATLLMLADWPPMLEFLLICAVTLALSFGAHRLIRRSRLLLFLFNGVPLRKQLAPALASDAIQGGTLR